MPFILLILAQLSQLEPLVQCWKEVVRVKTFVLFLILGGRHPGFLHGAWGQLWALTDTFHQAEKLSCFQFCRVVFILQQGWILTNAFSAFLEVIIWLLFFTLVIWCIALIDFQKLNQPCMHGEKNPTWSCCVIFFIGCWIWLAIFGGFLYPYSQKILIWSFISLWCLRLVLVSG